ncbi:MAG: Uma2 family endonuclease [Verrucomicrobiia bacterium]
MTNGSELHDAAMPGAILDIPEVRQRLSRLSVAEYHRLGEFSAHGRRTELIRGIVVEKMSKSPLHRMVCSRLFKLLLAQVPEGCSVWKEEPLTLADSEPEPDISSTRGTDADFASAHPSTAELVVEVSVSSPALDRANATLYAEANVREYWIVLANEQRIEVYRRPEQGRYQQRETRSVDATLTCDAFPTVQVRLADLFQA